MLIKNHKTKLYCPDSDIKDDDMDALQANFWIDEQDVWHVDCHICGGEHYLGDMWPDLAEKPIKPKSQRM